MQSLCLTSRSAVSVDGHVGSRCADSDEDVFGPPRSSGIDLSRREPSSVEEV
jgi:hypothetical protein